MRILYVTNILPFPPHDGGRIRRYQLFRALAAAHHVTLLAAAPVAADLEAFLHLNLETRFVPIPIPADGGRAPVAQAVRELLARVQFDAVHVAEVWQWPGERGLTGCRVVLDTENVQSVLLRRLQALKTDPGQELNRLAAEALERQAFRRADRLLACSEIDAELIRKSAPGAAVTVIPNGVDLSAFPFSPQLPRNGPPLLTYTGMFAYAPNADGAAYFAHSIWPRVRAALPEARFRLVGRCPTAEVVALGEIPGVEVIPDVPEILPYFLATDAVVVPLRAGSGTRLKILEALAVGRPVVTTSIGCEGLAVTDGEHLRIADGEEAFAQAICEILADPTGTAAMVRRGRQLVEEQYGWERIAAQLRKVYAGLKAELV